MSSRSPRHFEDPAAAQQRFLSLFLRSEREELRPVSEKPLKIDPPFRLGTAELGNWNARGFPANDPSLIRNFSGAMDEFCLFRRALTDDEICELYSAGKPDPDFAAGQDRK